MEYQTRDIEKKWQHYWKEKQVYKVSNQSEKPKFYVLDMFPYPSGAGLHVGHPLGYIASDIYARYKRLEGYNVLHPMGFDAFGLPAEQYAIKMGVHPATSTAENTARYREQLDNLGLSFDWSRQVVTSEPAYYRWTQDIFLKLFSHYYDEAAQQAISIEKLVATFEVKGNQEVRATTTQETVFTAEEWRAMSSVEQDRVLMNYRLAYRKVSYVNWCEALGTVLANDEVKDGLSERGGHPVMQKPMLQWSLRITAYAQRLLDGLEQVDFPEALKAQQRNWIGRSEGARVWFEIENTDEKIEVFTTRPDTIFGVSFMVLAPEHALVDRLTTTAQQQEIEAYKKYASARSERERQADVKQVTGAFTGAYALHPLTGAQVPIWISDYVLADYGTGAIMAVPSDDERDQRFAKHFELPIVEVVDQSAFPEAAHGDKVGTMINSDFLNGLTVKVAIEKAIEALEQKELGAREINYRLRDANFSRQRYWGEPIPVKYDNEGIAYASTSLPVELPELDNFKPTRDGRPPLARAEAWMNSEEGFVRELDTMPGFAGSSWYFLRYMDAQNDEAAFSKEAVSYWQEVDLYLGGAEHAVGHLLYSRFWHKFMFDLGIVPTREPFKKLVNQGMIQGIIEQAFMLKEKRAGKTVFVSADRLEEFGGEEACSKLYVLIDFIKNYGTEEPSHLDAAGIEAFKKWRPSFEDAIFETNAAGELQTVSELGKMSKSRFNVINPDDVVAEYGADCFRMYEMFLGPLEQSKPWDTQGIQGVAKFLRRFWGLFYDEQEGWQVTEEEPTADEWRALHTCIQKVRQDMEQFSFNTCISAFMVLVNDLRKLGTHKAAILEPMVSLIAPFAPHLAEELWDAFGYEGSIHALGAYPKVEEKYLKVASVEYPVCINGKKRASASFDAEADKKQIEEIALGLEEVQKWIEGKTIRKVIVVPKRMVNIVVG